jgi:hypothetical protein
MASGDGFYFRNLQSLSLRRLYNSPGTTSFARLAAPKETLAMLGRSLLDGPKPYLRMRRLVVPSFCARLI